MSNYQMSSPPNDAPERSNHTPAPAHDSKNSTEIIKEHSSKPNATIHTVQDRIIESHSILSAQAHVLAITELLEQILLHLPIFSLLRIQLVCGHWQSVIFNSPSILKGLYLRPTMPPSPESSRTTRWNFQIFKRRVLRRELSSKWSNYVGWRCGVDWGFFNWPYTEALQRREFEDEESPLVGGETELGNLSFMAMFSTQPPLTEVCIRGERPRSDDPEAWPFPYWEVKNAEGVTMGDILRDPRTFSFDRLYLSGRRGKIGREPDESSANLGCCRAGNVSAHSACECCRTGLLPTRSGRRGIEDLLCPHGFL